MVISKLALHLEKRHLGGDKELLRSLFYQWQKTFIENGASAFERERPRSRSLGDEQDLSIVPSVRDLGLESG